MKLIEDNPYRILGILADTSLKEKTKRISRLKMLIEAEQTPTDDYSFPLLGNLNRTIDVVEKAASSLDLDKDKLRSAIFWFCNGSHTDEPAFDLLKENNAEEAIQIWTKRTRSSIVSKSNYSAFLNLSTLKLWKAFDNGTIEPQLLRDSIELKLKFFESDFFTELVKLSTDEKFKVSRIELEEIFLKDVYEQVVRFGNGYEPKFWNSLKDIEYSAESTFEKNIVQEIVEKIETCINNSKKERKHDVTKSIEIGNQLIENTKDELEKVKKILGENNTKYTTLSDKISDEAAQCAIVYFNHFRETDFDPGEKAEALILRAKKFAIGRLTIDRLNDNSEGIKEWNDDKENRLKYKVVKNAIDELNKKLIKYKSIQHDSSSALQLIRGCKPLLAKIRDGVGYTNEMYLRLSTVVAVAAQNYIIEEFNLLSEKVERSKYSMLPEISNEQIRKILYLLHSAMLEVGKLDMENDFRRNGFLINRQVITDACYNMGVGIESNKTFNKISAKSSEKNITSQEEISLASIAIWILIIAAIIFMIYAHFGK